MRFRLPDPVLALPDRDRTDGTWMSGSDANESVMMQVPGAGAFLRALLPTRLTGGYSVTFGVWVGVRPDDLQHAARVWWAPEYADLRIEGVLANAISPWDVLGAPVELRVQDPEQTPYCVSSPDARLRSVLAEEWDHDLVLSSLPPQ
jgi:hypothetical protein